MTNIFLDSPEYTDLFRMIAEDLHDRFMKLAWHTSMEVAKITADEYQHNWLVCHELKLFGG